MVNVAALQIEPANPLNYIQIEVRLSIHTGAFLTI